MNPGPGGYKAHLDKKGYRVLCGSLECEADIAIRALAVSDRPFYLICFPPGWTAANNVWFMTRHARKRVARGRRPLDRREGALIGGTPVQELRRPALPTKARCPRCWAVNVLEQQVLGTDPGYPNGEFIVLEPWRWEGWPVEGDWMGTLPKR